MMCDQCEQHDRSALEMSWTEFAIGLISVLVIIAIIVFLVAVGVGVL